MGWGVVLAAGALVLAAQERAPRSCEEMEQFLRSGKLGVQRDIPKGITLPKRATLEHNGLQHDAAIQTVNISKNYFQGQRTSELNFRDFWGFNIAGYELAKILDLNMVPPYVERKVGGQSASLSWWVDGAMMEAERVRKKLQPPDPETWNHEMYVARVFNQLIANMDPNLTNFLITKDWKLWLIDFSRAFRMTKDPPNPKDLVRCERKLLAKLRALDRKELEEKLVKPRYLNKMELDGLMARRDKIVAFFEKEIAAKGEGAVLFDLPRVGETCGVGL